MTSEVTPEYGAKFLRERTSSAGSFLDAIPEDAAEMAAAIEKFVRAELPGFTAGLKAHERGMMPKLLKKSGELGLLSIGIPEEYGGLQLPFTYQALIAEKTAINPPFSVSAGVTSCLATLPILLYGTEDQKQKWLPKLASGETLAAFALTEEEAGNCRFLMQILGGPLARRRLSPQRHQNVDIEWRICRPDCGFCTGARFWPLRISGRSKSTRGEPWQRGAQNRAQGILYNKANFRWCSSPSRSPFGPIWRR